MTHLTSNLRSINKGRAAGLQIRIDTEPAGEPVTDTELKNYLKIDFTDDDTLIGEIITAARREAEEYTGRKFITQTLTAYWDTYSSDMILPCPPHQSITSVTEKWQNDSTVFVADTDYYLQGVDQFRLKMATIDAVKHLEVKFITGYGDDATDIPKEIKIAIMKIASNMYDFREDFIDGSITEIPDSARWLLSSFKVWN